MPLPGPNENEKDSGILEYSAVESLEEIERTLHQILLLAELSASDVNVDRERLQAVLDRLRDKIDRIADQL